MKSKGSAIPTRFDAPEIENIQRLHRETGLSVSEIIRRANRLALPKFLSGAVSINARRLSREISLAKARRANGRKTEVVGDA